jgi:hypothetical protein
MKKFSLRATHRLIQKISSFYYQLRPLRITDYYKNTTQQPKGTILLSYLAEPLTWRPDDIRFSGHANLWRIADIARIINDLCYSVDIIAWHDSKYISKRPYTAVIDIHKNLIRYSSDCSVKILHLTGSDPRFSNKAELQRIADAMERRGVLLKPRRQINQEEINLFDQNLDAADYISIHGNKVTVDTYPEYLRQKMQYIPVNGSFLPRLRDLRTAKFSQEFLWHGGVGAVHKGLDLVLEVFSRHPELSLHVVGPYLKEKDFLHAYRHELTNCQNIVSHSFLFPSSAKFCSLAKRLRGFIFPSCSEGISPAAVTCMQYGILPIVSTNCGLDINDSMGIELETCSVETIEAAVISLCDTHDDDIRSMTIKAQNYALNKYSREAFSGAMELFLDMALP